MNERPGGRVRAAIVLLTAIVATLVWPTPAMAAPAGQVYLLQGLPGRHVDLFLNGEKVGSDVAPKTVVGPLALAAGSYQLRVAASGGSTLLQRAITVSASDSLDAVVHLDAEASPTPSLTVFTNDRSPINAGKTRLAIAHVAAVPAADIRVDGTVLFSNVANGEGLTTVVPAASYSVDVVPTGTDGPAVLGPATFKLSSGTLTRVFAIGQPALHTMDAIVQVITVTARNAGAPNNIDTGSGGAAAPTQHSATAAALFGTGLLLLSIAGAAVWHRRRREPSTT